MIRKTKCLPMGIKRYRNLLFYLESLINKPDPAHPCDLILVSPEGWKNQEFFKKTPSVLILCK
jgi:hypothetical protein